MNLLGKEESQHSVGRTIMIDLLAELKWISTNLLLGPRPSGRAPGQAPGGLPVELHDVGVLVQPSSCPCCSPPVLAALRAAVSLGGPHSPCPHNPRPGQLWASAGGGWAARRLPCPQMEAVHSTLFIVHCLLFTKFVFEDKVFYKHLHLVICWAKFLFI